MADIKISGLTAAASATGAMQLEVNDAGASKSVTINQIQDKTIGTTNGVLARTAANTVTARTITASTGIVVSNGDGVSANPTIAVNLASQAEAQAGTENTKPMTALRTAQAISTLAPASPVPGLVFISAQTVSTAVASVDFTGLTSTYDEYVIFVQNCVPTTDGKLQLRTSTNGAVSYDAAGTDYSWGGIGNSSSSPSPFAADASAVDLCLGNTTVQATSNLGGANAEISVIRPASATEITQFRFVLTAKASNGMQANIGGGARNSVADIDAVRLYFSSGTIASGFFKLYGMRKS